MFFGYSPHFSIYCYLSNTLLRRRPFLLIVLDFSYVQVCTIYFPSSKHVFWEILNSNCISDTCVIDIKPLPGTLVCDFGNDFVPLVGCNPDDSWY